MQMAQRRGCVTGTLGAGGVASDGCVGRGRRTETEVGRFCHVPAHTQQLSAKERNAWPHNNTYTQYKKCVCNTAELEESLLTVAALRKKKLKLRLKCKQ